MNLISLKRTQIQLKHWVVGLLCLAFAALPASLLYLVWSWAIAQVPATYEMAWAAKLAITFGLIVVGGSATLALTFMFAIGAFTLYAMLTE